MSNLKKFEIIYGQPDKAQWTFKEIPNELKELLEKEKVKPCKMLDIGCGEGYHSIYFASKGFQVVGMDSSAKAIEYAKRNAEKSGVSCSFLTRDFTYLTKLQNKFDFILDWRVLHEIIDQKERKNYVKSIHNLLNKKGKYLSVSFSVRNKLWGKGKVRKAPNTDIYLSFTSDKDLEELFKPYFKMLKKRIIKVPERGIGNLLANYFFMELKYSK